MKEYSNIEETQAPLVTIGIPVYNVEPYIEKCLLSVLNQTYNNLEIIIVDDLGTDKSMEIVEQLQLSHPNGHLIKILKHQYNKGLGEARNSVLENAHGKYVFFIDPDDYIESFTIEKLLSQAIKYQADVTIASMRKVVWETKEEIPTLQYSSHQVIDGEDAFANFVCSDLRWHIAITACNILFLRDFLNKNNLRFAARKDEDSLFLSDYYSEVKKAVLLPDITYNYIIRPGSIMGNNEREHIPVSEIRERFKTDTIMTERCKRLIGRPFYDVHCARVMKHKFRAVCVALRHKHRFTETLQDKEIRQEMKHPASFMQIIRFKRYRGLHFLFWGISILPSNVCVFVCNLVGKVLKWI